jgi:hypothetical protein
MTIADIIWHLLTSAEFSWARNASYGHLGASFCQFPARQILPLGPASPREAWRKGWRDDRSAVFHPRVRK